MFMTSVRAFAGCLLVPTLVTASPGALAQQPRGDYYGPHMMWETGWMFLGPLMMILFVALIVVAVVLLVRWLSDHRTGDRPGSDGRALEILKERFARGEIDKEEYEERRRLLRD